MEKINPTVYACLQASFDSLDWDVAQSYMPATVKVDDDFYESLRRGKNKQKSATSGRIQATAPKPSQSAVSPSWFSQPSTSASVKTSEAKKDKEYIPKVIIAPVDPKPEVRSQRNTKRKIIEDEISDEEKISPAKKQKVARADKRKSRNGTPKTKKLGKALKWPEVSFIQKSSFELYHENELKKAHKAAEKKRESTSGKSKQTANRTPRGELKYILRATSSNKKFSDEEMQDEFDSEKKPKTIVEINRAIDDPDKQEQFLFLFELKPKIV